MKAFYGKYIMAMTTVMVLGACSSPKQNTQTIKLDSITDNETLTIVEKAERLSLAGEQLITPSSFMFADLVFDHALALDPKNTRAKFYKLFLAPKMELKGALAKAKYIAEQDPKSKASYDKTISEIPNSELRNFLLDGSSAIKTEKDAQKLLGKVYDRYNEFRLFLKNNKKMDLTLNLNPLFFTEKVSDESKACEVEKVDDVTYNMNNCDMAGVLQIKLDRADIEVLQHYTSGIQLYMTAFLAYDLSGLYEVEKKYKDVEVNNNQVFKELLSNPSFGKLNDPKYFSNIKSMGIDYVSAARWAYKINDQLCPAGKPAPGSRKGHIVEKGICVLSGHEGEGMTQDEVIAEFKETLDVVDMVLAGKSMRSAFGPEEKEYETEVNYSAILDNPIKDIRNLGLQLNSCGDVVGASDKSLGGFLPRQDLDLVLKADEAGSDCL